MAAKGDVEEGYRVNHSFGITLETLDKIQSTRDEDPDAWDREGGLEKVAAKLQTSLDDGISPDSEQDRQAAFGANKFKEVPPKAFFTLLYEQLKDPTLMLLMAAALFQTVLGASLPEEREKNAYVEGVAIWVAVIVVSMVGAVNDWKKDQQFRKINAERDTFEVKVIRGGHETLVTNVDVCVGDLLVLDTGDKVVADGYFVRGFDLVIDESSLTGESDPIKKSDKRPWCLSGTQVTEGSGTILVTAVGEKSQWGKTMALVVGEAEDTPLQEKLAVLASAIGKVGMAVGVLCFLVLIISWMVEFNGGSAEHATDILDFFIFGVTIVVVAVPEGLPLAVTISLAYSMRKMMKDNNFVRVLAACETMGGATAICSDKTGTLTENRMTVVEGLFYGKKFGEVPKPEDFTPELLDHLAKNCGLNGKAFLQVRDDGIIDFVGNRTECALLVLLRKLGFDYEKMRKDFPLERLYGFSSAKKMAACLLKTDASLRLYNKGASEWVLEKCTDMLMMDGSKVPLDAAKKAELTQQITDMASRGLRTLSLTIKDLPLDTSPESYEHEAPDDGLTLCCVVGIKDPVRQEVPDAVATCKRAGITVRMVTGDNINTARHIARECGILYGDGIAMEGPKFRQMNYEEIVAMVDRLQVLARSSPEDKYTLVSALKERGDVVAVTGDGTNDAPALKESDVGLAMGKTGTEVAKEASDIVILDDNFTSIVKAVLWGRNVFNSIRKFLQFQLTINFVALTLAFISAVAQKGTPLNVMQLLWVNLVMDSLAALALATELPNPKLLKNKPYGRSEPLISKKMWKHIVGVGFYQLLIMLLIIFITPEVGGDYYTIPSECSLSNADALGLLTAQGVSLEAAAVISEGDLENVLTVSLEDGGRSYQVARHASGCIQVGGPDTAVYASGTPEHAALSRMEGESEDVYETVLEEQEQHTNSIVFNAFIWMQLVNELNSRKIQDELNVLQGITHSPIFFFVLVFSAAMQVLFIMTPINQFFKVVEQDGIEWMIAILCGLGCFPVSFILRLFGKFGKDPSELESGESRKHLGRVSPSPEKEGVENGNGVANGH
ncbi:unnamed protein product [Pedinophyceae sp. YPF-701]|nr:unnamed protein product [Pedinophyceae sp. YPF-701]